MKQIIIDTREPSEFSRSHVDGAINIPVMEFATGELPQALEGVDKDTPIILYCISGQRSNTCGRILTQFGFTNLTNGVNEGQVRHMLSKK